MKGIEERLGLSSHQRDQLQAYEQMLLDINRRHNLISSASAHDVRSRHVEHSLELAVRSFPSGAVVVDWGTGGGLPGIPLAICFPGTEFVLVDAVEKKVRAVELMARRLKLTNVQPWRGRADEFPGTAHFAVSRATAPLVTLWAWSHRVLQPAPSAESGWPGGLLALKGGDLRGELAALHESYPRVRVEKFELSDVHERPEKAIMHVSDETTS